MAKLLDKFFNKVIVGKLVVQPEDEGVAQAVVSSAQSGTIDKVLGLDSNGNLVKGSVGGGTQLYKHSLGFDDQGDGEVHLRVDVLMLTSTPLTTTGNNSFSNNRQKIITILDSGNSGKAFYFFYDNGWKFRQQDDYYKDLMDYDIGEFIDDVVTPL